MDTLKIIYTILQKLEKSMDEERPDFSDIKAEALGISKAKWSRILEMMYNRDLIDGICFVDMQKQPYPGIKLKDLKITLDGLEYLAENSTTAKIFKAAKEIKDIIPGL